MASPPYSLPPVLTERWSAVRWPATAGRRTLTRLALSAPYVVLAVWLQARGVHSLPNAQLERVAGSLSRPGATVGAVTRAFPPLGPAIARLLPGGPGTLGIVGALGAGAVLHLCWERLVRASVPRWLIVLLLAGVGGSPIFWYNATGNLVGFVGLIAFVVAAAGLLDFLYLGRTTGGYAAGLSMAFAVLCDPAALVYALSMAIAIPFLGWERFRGEPIAILSAVAVVVFPTVAAVTAWAFLEWRFTGTVNHSLLFASGAFGFPAGLAGGLRAAASHVGWELTCAPVFAVGAVSLLPRRPMAAVGLLAVPLDLVLTAWFGLHAQTGQGIVLLSIVGLMAVPSRPNRIIAAVLAVEAVAGAVCTVALSDVGGTAHLLRAMGL